MILITSVSNFEALFTEFKRAEISPAEFSKIGKILYTLGISIGALGATLIFGPTSVVGWVSGTGFPDRFCLFAFSHRFLS